MKRFSLLASLLLIFVPLYSQDIVKFEDLTFSSEFERKALSNYFIDKKPDYFSLFVASGKSLNETAIDKAAARLKEHIAALKATASNKRKDKNIKYIYNEVHGAFFKKYEEQNAFEEIFINGKYNCVSASALYAIVLEELEIPYVVKESPRHVFLVAYPGTENIIVEATDPTTGSIALTDQFKTAFVQRLKNQKLISAQEFETTHMNVLFDKYYFGDQHDITLPQLVGIQYYNEGIYAMLAKRPKDALTYFEKSYLFYPNERLELLMLEATHNVFKAMTPRDAGHGLMLAKLSKYKAHGITPEMIEGEHARVINDLLFDRGETEKLKQYHATLLAALGDGTLKDDLAFNYEYEFGRWLYNQGKFSQAIDHFKGCLKLRPGHVESARLLFGCIAESLGSRSNTEAIQALEKYGEEFPMLTDNNNYKELLGITYLIEMRTLFESGSPTNAEKMKSTFEAFQKANSTISFNNYIIGQAYSSAAVHYFRKGNTAKAKAVLNKGLEISPNNQELTARMRMIN